MEVNVSCYTAKFRVGLTVPGVGVSKAQMYRYNAQVELISTKFVTIGVVTKPTICKSEKVVTFISNSGSIFLTVVRLVFICGIDFFLAVDHNSNFVWYKHSCKILSDLWSSKAIEHNDLADNILKQNLKKSKQLQKELTVIEEELTKIITKKM